MICTQTPIINQIENAVSNIPGWTPIDQLYSLYNLALITSDLGGDILEVGSWCGRSSVILGMAAAQTGSRVTCIDLFPSKNDWEQNEDGSYSFAVGVEEGKVGGYQEQTVWKEPFERDIAPIYDENDSILDRFLQSIKDSGLQDVVEPVKGTSSAIKELDNQSFRVAFIDADHSYDAVCKDIDNVDGVLLPGGWICFDDAFSHYEGVNKAIEKKIINNNRYIYGQQMTRKFFTAKKVK